MRVQLLGTGSSDGWPNPWCTCASCEWARSSGELRGHTAALLDGELLIDCGPDVPRSAGRLGIALSGVRTLLLTHAHPDHTGAEALMWRGWSTAAALPLTVIGPPAALEACRRYVGEGDPVLLRPVAPGDVLEHAEYRIEVLAARHSGPEAGPAVLFDITGRDGTRLLYATDTAPLPEDALPSGPFDVVLLECTFGDRRGVGDHHDLDDLAATLAALRRKGAVAAATRVVAVHLGHGNPPGAELGRRLALLGAEALPDGAVVGSGAAPPERARRVLVTGGARSGKSLEAERRLLGAPEVVYVATAPELPDDAEWTARLDAHRQRRPAGWRTVETAVLAPLLSEPGAPLLVDDVGLWLTRGEESADEFVEAWRAAAREVVLVTAEVGSGVVPSTPSGRRFRDELGRLNARLAAEADEVWQCTAGIAGRLR